MRHAKAHARNTKSELAKLEARVDEVDSVSGARSLAGLAIAYMDEDFIEEALETFQEAAAISRTHADWDNAGWCEHVGAICLKELGRFEESMELLESCRQIFVDMGNLHAIAETDGVSFVCLEALGRYDEALAKLRTARSISSKRWGTLRRCPVQGDRAHCSEEVGPRAVVKFERGRR